MAKAEKATRAAPVARKHHYVPQMYLSGFANANDQCFVVNADTKHSFMSPTDGIAAQRDFNRIDVPGVPADALEKELGNFEGVIAPGILRVRTSATFGENGVDREDIINLVTLLAVRNPRKRKDMEQFYNSLFHAMAVMPFESKERWEAVVEQMKAAGKWDKDFPADYEGHKKYIEENVDKLKVDKWYQLETELDQLEQLYPYFDARRWRLLKAGDDTGGFVTTDHPVCVHRPSDGMNYGQQFAPGLGLGDRDILIALSPKVALVGRLEGEEDVVEVDRHSVASFNATVMGYAMRQVYAQNDQFIYTRAAPQPPGTGSTLVQDLNLKVREEE